MAATSAGDAGAREREAVREAVRMNRELLERAQRDLRPAASRNPVAPAIDGRNERQAERLNSPAVSLGSASAISRDRRDRPADRRTKAPTTAAVAAGGAPGNSHASASPASATATTAAAIVAEIHPTVREVVPEQPPLRAAAAGAAGERNDVAAPPGEARPDLGEAVNEDRRDQLGPAVTAGTEIAEAQAVEGRDQPGAGSGAAGASDDSSVGMAAADDNARADARTEEQTERRTDEVATLALATADTERDIVLEDRQAAPDASGTEGVASDGAAVRVAAITGAAVVAVVAAVAGLAAIMGPSSGAPAGPVPRGHGRAQDRTALSGRREDDLAPTIEQDPRPTGG